MPEGLGGKKFDKALEKKKNFQFNRFTRSQAIASDVF